MAIIEKIKENGEKVYQYDGLSEDVLYDMISELAEILGKYVSKLKNIDLEDVRLDEALVGEAYTRVDKRRDYFVVFHDDTQMNELKETALLVYWILKFKPIRIVNDELQKKYPYINENFAVFLIYSTIKEETTRNPQMIFSVSKDYTSKLSYALKYWDLDKEALMLVMESLCEGMTVKKGDD
ncbi:hypothetical protein IKB17_06500 [bacterium]|nr:hypothetical protein [bacterium]